MQTMYWNGVKRELAHILLTLRKWQQPKYASTILSDETDDFIHGFDTFIDQVSETAREFADRYGTLKSSGLWLHCN
jgi:soluble cytochrome b562